MGGYFQPAVSKGACLCKRVVSISGMSISFLHPAYLPAEYPTHLERTLALAGGREVLVRPIVPTDAADLAAAILAADEETLYFRFFTPRPRLGPRELRYLTEVDYRRRLALVAFSNDGEGVAVGRYEGLGEDEAEVAVVVAPAWRRSGLAAALIEILAGEARQHGMSRLVAHYLVENRPAAAMLAAAGFGSPAAVDGVETVTRDLAP